MRSRPALSPLFRRPLRLLPLLALFLPTAASTADPSLPPQIAPAYIAARYAAIGYVTNRRPAPGGGEGIGGCTATLISPTEVLTAAHCVERAPDDRILYVTFGWRDGPPLWRSPVSARRLPEGHRIRRFSVQSARQDVALLTLPRPVPADLVAPIPVAAPLPEAAYAIWGYRMGDPTELSGHDHCRVQPLDELLLASDCTVVSGFSGAPLLMETGAGPALAAVVVGTFPASNPSMRSLAVLPDAVLTAPE